MKKLLLILTIILCASSVFAQRHKKDTIVNPIQMPGDSISMVKDSVITDSIDIAPKRKNAVDSPISYECKDSMLISLDDKKVFLYGSGQVESIGMKLNADNINIEMETNAILAQGTLDSTTNEVKGSPVFKQGNEEFEAQLIKYNFKTRTGFVNDVVTEENDGYLYGRITKMHPNKEIHLKGGRYTTCDDPHPHFYLNLTRAKVIPGDKIVSGPAYFVLLDVPVYVLGLPFCIFPNSKKNHGGVIIPSYGEEKRRGFYLRDGGYYFSFGDYADLKLLGSYYTYGSWGMNVISNYKWRYKFSGSLNFSYIKNKYGEKEFEGTTHSDLKYVSSNAYKLAFNFNQDPKANPTTSFSCNVNYDKSFDKSEARSLSDIQRSTSSSSISFSKRFLNGKFNLSLNGNMTQNLTDSTLTLTAPSASFNMQKVFPFKRKVQVGKQKFYEKISVGFNSNFQNRVPTIPDSIFMKKEMFDKMTYGIGYDVPISTSSFNLFKYINVTPTFNYSGAFTPNRLEPYADYSFNYADDANVKTQNHKVAYDTIPGWHHLYEYSFSLSATTKLYGMLEFKNSRIKAFRHVLTPSISANFKPDFAHERYGFFSEDPFQDTTKEYSKRRKLYNYQNAVYQKGNSQGRQGSLSFSLGNIFEMKVKGKKDTVDGQFTKIKIFDNLNLSGSYNFMADSCKLSNIAFNGSTNLFNKLRLSFSGTLNPYEFDSKGMQTKTYAFEASNGKTWAHLTAFNVSTNYSIDQNTFKRKNEKSDLEKEAEDDITAETDEFGNITLTAEEIERKRMEDLRNKKRDQKEQSGEYDYYHCPWSISGGYTFGFNHIPNKPRTLRQTLNLSGSLSFTDKWHMSVTSGYDFDAKRFTSTQISATRSLHCFNLSFSIIPYGTYKSYNFNLSFNSSIFRGLEYKRNQSWRDN